MALQTATGALSLSPRVVSNSFVAQYYEAISSRPKEVYKFYKESSSLSRPASSEAMAPVTTVQGQHAAITDLIMSLEYYKDCLTQIVSVDSQSSQDDGVFVLVSAYLILRDKIQLKFSQTFFLASEGNGKYFVLNDILRFVDEVQPEEYDQLSNGSTNDVAETPHISDLDSPEVACVQDQQSDIEIQQLEGLLENSEEIHCTSQKGDAVGEKEPSAEPSVTQPEVVCVQDRHNDTEIQELEGLLENSEEIHCTSQKGDAAGEKESSAEPSVTQPVSKVTPSSEPEIGSKKSYAAIVKVKGTSSAVPPKVPTSKARSTSSGPAKPINGPEKPLAASRKDTTATKVSVTGSSVSDKEISDDGEGYLVYVRNLPWSVTVDRVEMEFKRFGPIKSRGVQVRRNEFWHYYYAFVEFESMRSMQDALEASPVMVEGREAYVEEKRPKNRVRNVVITGGGRRDRYARGNGGFRNDDFRGNGGFSSHERTDFRNQRSNSGPGRVQGSQQRPVQNGNGSMVQQRPVQNGDGRKVQQHHVWNGDGRMGQRPVQNGNGRMARSGVTNQGNRSKH